MRIALVVLMVAGLFPLVLALVAHRRTSLFHALVWTLIAWVSWGLTLAFADPADSDFAPARYWALCLTGCAGIAVLGARRPQVFAWNFVVLGLLAVMIWPLVETLVIGTPPVAGLRIAFLAGTVAVAALNYLPTRFGPAALVLLVACAGELVLLVAPTSLPRIGDATIFDALLAIVPWLGWGCLRTQPAEGSDFDRLWLRFRDSWGFMWSQRVREQFNHAAQNAGWAVRLSWRGLVEEKQTPTALPADQEKLVELLWATLQRFVETEEG
ncbi:MAG: hypothetical protein EXR98_15955 [Gemmataceae bacterium]|nr:hypothetical protein [Gemmataceae bacterium]